VRFTLNHGDPRSCPTGAQYGESVGTGGKVDDETVQPGITPNTIGLTVGGYEYASSFDCSGSLGSTETEYLQWGPHRSQIGSSEWQAEAWAGYNVGGSPDYGCFAVGLWSDVDDAKANIVIDYGGTEMSNICRHCDIPSPRSSCS